MPKIPEKLQEEIIKKVRASNYTGKELKEYWMQLYMEDAGLTKEQADLYVCGFIISFLEGYGNIKYFLDRKKKTDPHTD